MLTLRFVCWDPPMFRCPYFQKQQTVNWIYLCFVPMFLTRPSLWHFRLQPNMKCIVFVNRIVTARSLSYILQNLEFLASWKCDFLVGINSGLKSASRKAMKIILEKFRSGEVMLKATLLTTDSNRFSVQSMGMILWPNCFRS